MPNMQGIYDLTTCKPTNMITNAGISGGSYSSVSPGLKGMYSEEVVAGIQYDVGYDLVLGASYIHRDLGRIIEDMSPNAGSDFLIANPGETPDPGVIKDLQSQIAATNGPDEEGGAHQGARPLPAGQRRLPQAEA